MPLGGNAQADQLGVLTGSAITSGLSSSAGNGSGLVKDGNYILVVPEATGSPDSGQVGMRHMLILSGWLESSTHIPFFPTASFTVACTPLSLVCAVVNICPGCTQQSSMQLFLP